MSNVKETYPLYKSKTLDLWNEGQEAVLLAKNEMPGMLRLEAKYKNQNHLKEQEFLGCLHMTVQTA